MAYSELVQLKISGPGGVERDLVANETMTMWHLHRAIQFCLAPSQSDDTVAAKVRPPQTHTFESVVWCLASQQGLVDP